MNTQGSESPKKSGAGVRHKSKRKSGDGGAASAATGTAKTTIGKLMDSRAGTDPRGTIGGGSGFSKSFKDLPSDGAAEVGAMRKSYTKSLRELPTDKTAPVAAAVKKPLHVRKASIDFPLGAFAPRTEIPTKSNRDKLLTGDKGHHHHRHHNKDGGGKKAAPGTKTKKEKASVADIADMALSDEIADLELGQVGLDPEAKPTTATRGRAGKHRGAAKGRNKKGLDTPAAAATDTTNGTTPALQTITSGVVPNYGTNTEKRRDSLRYSGAINLDSLDLPASSDLPEEIVGVVGGMAEMSPKTNTGQRKSISTRLGGYDSNMRSSLIGADLLESAGSFAVPTPPSNNDHNEMTGHVSRPSQQQMNDISMFAAMALGNYSSPASAQASPAGSFTARKKPLIDTPPKSPVRKAFDAPSPESSTDEEDKDEEEEDGSYISSNGSYSEYDEEPLTWYEWIMALFDPTWYLMSGVKFDEKDMPYFDEWNGWGLAGFLRTFFYNPLSPEFTALQQFNWAVVIGIVMGVYTAVWKFFIEFCVSITWEKIPEYLLEKGVFTEPEGRFPLYHYMWICPAIFGGVLSYAYVSMPHKIPDQNEWIDNIHNRGVQDYRPFFYLFFLATGAMSSGMSLGPELPLVLTSGMAGSWLGLTCKQSVLQARVMNLTAASAAIGGFFGFPMAGALFVLELPHRMGLQYFEALSPATIASIVAVLCNRIIIGNDVTGYYKYPFLTATLPSEIFTSAILFGLYGTVIGIIYLSGCKKLKGIVHDWFHAPHDDHETGHDDHQAPEGSTDGEKKPLLDHKQNNGTTDEPKKAKAQEKPRTSLLEKLKKCTYCAIPNESYRSAAAGTVAGALVGIICMFVPHAMFWGEAQLQTLIDRGATPLPIFGFGDEPTAGLTTLGYCLLDPSDPENPREFGIACAFLIGAAKIVTTGLSLGTGIIAGHFWGPLFVGCAMSHFLVDAVRLFHTYTGFGGSLAQYPCVALLCVMGSTHIVTFRAHMAIMLILTLTISAFNPENDDGDYSVAGDYSAVFPLLVVSVFVSLIASRSFVFYPMQRSRGDIMAVPEVLCEPGMEGRPVVIVQTDEYEGSGGDDFATDVAAYMLDEKAYDGADAVVLTQSDIEKEFSERGGSPSLQIPSFSTSQPTGGAPAAGSLRSSRSASPTVFDTSKDFMDRVSAAGMPPPRISGPSSIPRSPRAASPAPPTSLSTISTYQPNSAGGLPGADSFDVFDSVGGGGGGKGHRPKLSSARLDELLSKPLEDDVTPLPSISAPMRRRHKRITSAPIRHDESNIHELDKRFGGPPKDAGKPPGGAASARPQPPQHARTNSGGIARIVSYGEVKFQQPSLLDQARARAASSDYDSLHRRVESGLSGRPGHSRQNSTSSIGSNRPAPPTRIQSSQAVLGHNRTPSGSALMNRQSSGISSSGVSQSSSTNPPPPIRAHRRKNSEPIPRGHRHIRHSSSSSSAGGSSTGGQKAGFIPRAPKTGGALPLDDIEFAFDSLLKSGNTGL